MTSKDVWAILKSDGRQICDYTGLDDFQDNSAATVPTEPQENGQIYAYDKVTNPIEVGVSVLFHGDFTLQQEALSAIEAARSGTELFTIVTPARVYSRMALISYSITRSSTNGANSLSVDCRFQEIRNATIRSQTGVWSPKNPTSSDVVNTGQKSLLGDLIGSYSVSNVPGQNGG